MRWFDRKRPPKPGTDPWVLNLTEPECPLGWTPAPPDFVGLGVPRSGTSWWYRDALQAHPQVAATPGRAKEIHFLDQYAAREVDSDAGERYARFFPRPPGAIAGEWTPDYLFAPWNLSLLADIAPDARFLIMLRDPVERFRSEISPALEGLAESGLNALTMLSVSSSVHHSSYFEHVRRAFEILGRDRVLLLQYEMCLESPLSEMQRTQRFLGLDPFEDLPANLDLVEGSQLRYFPAEKFDVPVGSTPT